MPLRLWNSLITNQNASQLNFLKKEEDLTTSKEAFTTAKISSTTNTKENQPEKFPMNSGRNLMRRLKNSEFATQLQPALRRQERFQ